jgi:hypothetical protein
MKSAAVVGTWTDCPAINRTGVMGLFAIETEGWRLCSLVSPGRTATPTPEGDPTILTIYQPRLGPDVHHRKRGTANGKLIH